ncbi:MAG: dehydrogenase [Deltaproteobacteria bacterium]|nr:dehydrogenase [Deltaproteobacteria bacterium]
MIRALILLFVLSACDSVRAIVIKNYPQDHEPVTVGSAGASANSSIMPAFSGPDKKREQVAIVLTPVMNGLDQITDMQFVPKSSTHGLILEKKGIASHFDLSTGKYSKVLEIDVLTKSEQGLLGAAFHPQWETNGRVFFHTSVEVDGKEVSEISEWNIDPKTWKAQRTGTILQVVQPYANHNAGQISFGPDNMLFIGLGDGGWRNDPHEHGQNKTTWLGSMLRIDVNSNTETPYINPADNPFLNDNDIPDEIWATGIRNPWKFSFGPDGRMILADVGQNAYEEVSIVQSGDNLGWNTREARHCFPPDSTCSKEGFVEPIYEYGHDEGRSITGGYVATSSHIPPIQNHYVFGDFVTGRLWAIPLPKDRSGPLMKAKSLGQWPFMPSTFGQGADGTLYVAAFSKGTVFRMDPK